METQRFASTVTTTDCLFYCRGVPPAGFFCERGKMSVVDFVCTAALILIGIPVVYFDLKCQSIPNVIPYSGIVLGIIALVFFRRPEFLNYTLAFISGFGLFYVFYLFGWVGGADVKLIGMIGLLMGPGFLVESLFYISVFGGLLALGVMGWRFFKKQKVREAKIPYGTAIVAGTYIVLFQCLKG